MTDRTDGPDIVERLNQEAEGHNCYDGGTWCNCGSPMPCASLRVLREAAASIEELRRRLAEVGGA